MKYVIWMISVGSMMICCQQKDKSMRTWNNQDRELLISKLQTSFDSVILSVENLSEKQWNWSSDSTSWSIAQIVEHLITHDELFHRDVRVISALPLPALPSEDHFASDENILSYREVNTENRGPAPSYLQPLGRWGNKTLAINAYTIIRKSIIDFVSSTDNNLRAYITKSGRGPTEFRDLHQLLLISYAHTMRHVYQIQEITNHPDFPED